MSGFSDDYVEVADRITEFFVRYPDGRLTSEIVELTDKRVTVKALAYRKADDPVPATGHSWLAIPGSTNFTRGSELENAETSAVGRAIVMAGIPSKKVASANEVRAKAAPAPAGQPKVAAPAAAPVIDLEDDAQWAAVMATVQGSDAPAPVAAAPDEPYRHHGPTCPVHTDREWKDTARGPKCTKNDGTREEPVWCKWQPSRKWLASQEVAR